MLTSYDKDPDQTADTQADPGSKLEGDWGEILALME